MAAKPTVFPGFRRRYAGTSTDGFRGVLVERGLSRNLTGKGEWKPPKELKGKIEPTWQCDHRHASKQAAVTCAMQHRNIEGWHRAEQRMKLGS